MKTKLRQNDERSAVQNIGTTELMSTKTSKRKTYYDFVKEAQKPISERKATVEGRNGELRPIRRHHLDELPQSALLKRMESEGKFISPYKSPGGYWGATEALSKLGANEYHPIANVLKAMQEIMSADQDKAGKTAWERFKGKRPKSRKNGLDWFGRVIQNLSVLQRIGGDDPYGLKLVQVGACIDLKPDEHGSPMARLRTGIPKGEAVVPVNELKLRHCARSVESIPSQISFPSAPATSKRRSRSETNETVSPETIPVSENVSAV